ncbi:hypothetical protein F2P81_025976 [Scophthalmus maximus]|uniref:PiggyBac transposable element-derived protein domain-containing protein n=1 Tax=Scophthalmus maximus TaxID=52904 RepID=A0A6A4RRA6_SCOMX|nr:hypothetical protein F2P81_025976 [Scophthalmus maximus]
MPHISTIKAPHVPGARVHHAEPLLVFHTEGNLQCVSGRVQEHEDLSPQRLDVFQLLALTSQTDRAETARKLPKAPQLFLQRLVGNERRDSGPQELVSARGRQVFSSRFAFSELATLVSYVPKRGKTVLLLSTGHPRPKIDSQRKDRKPHLILDYNRTKGGVDNLDKVLAAHSCRRMTERWPVALFHNIIWREMHLEWMPGKRNRRRLFLEQLGKDLVTPLIMRREHAPRGEPAYTLMSAVREACSDATAPQRSEKRKRCTLPFCAMI